LGHKIETLLTATKHSHHNKKKDILSHQISRNLSTKDPTMSSPEVSDHVDDDASPEVSEHEESSPVAPAKEEASVASTTASTASAEREKQDAARVHKAPEENRKKYEPKVWRKKVFQGVSLIFAMQQRLADKNRKGEGSS
jgi:hypothetical protein